MRILELVAKCVADINKRIVSCNDPKNKHRNDMFKPLVLLAQIECDKILADNSKSFLQRILLCGQAVNKAGAGNCMMQSFLAFEQLIKKLLAENIITMQKMIPMAICTTQDHAFLMVDDIVCDPWGNYYGKWDKSPLASKKVTNFFRIDAKWNCFDGNVYDATSTGYTFDVVSQFSPVASASACAVATASAVATATAPTTAAALGK